MSSPDGGLDNHTTTNITEVGVVPGRDALVNPMANHEYRTRHRGGDGSRRYMVAPGLSLNWVLQIAIYLGHRAGLVTTLVTLAWRLGAIEVTTTVHGNQAAPEDSTGCRVGRIDSGVYMRR
jgi:hypothetical protein